MSLRQRILAWAQGYTASRPPDFVVGNRQLERWWLIPRNGIFNLYLHRFNSSDEDRALHDHPWVSLGWILGPEGYNEVTKERIVWRPAGSIVPRLPTTAHCIVLPSTVPVHTLFLTGPVVRQWGFHCPRGWVHWKQFVTEYPGGNSAGRGCEQ